MTARARTTTAIRFEAKLHQRLTAAAKQHERSINWMVNEAVRRFLDDLIPAKEIPLTRSDDWIKP